MFSISVAQMTEEAAYRLSLKDVTQPNYEARSGDCGMNLISCQPDPDGEQRYFMLLAIPTVKANQERLRALKYLTVDGIQFIEILNARVDTLTSAGEDDVSLIQPL